MAGRSQKSDRARPSAAAPPSVSICTRAGQSCSVRDPFIPFRIYAPAKCCFTFTNRDIHTRAHMRVLRPSRTSWQLLDCPINVALVHVKVCETNPPPRRLKRDIVRVLRFPLGSHVRNAGTDRELTFKFVGDQNHN